jgi:hypothetical protein
MHLTPERLQENTCLLSSKTVRQLTPQTIPGTVYTAWRQNITQGAVASQITGLEPVWYLLVGHVKTWTVKSSWNVMAHGDAREGKWRGKLANGVGSQYSSNYLRNMVYPALLPLMRSPRLPVVDWTDAPAYLNGLVRFAERRNLVSARVPSHLKRSLTILALQTTVTLDSHYFPDHGNFTAHKAFIRRNTLWQLPCSRTPVCMNSVLWDTTLRPRVIGSRWFDAWWGKSCWDPITHWRSATYQTKGTLRFTYTKTSPLQERIYEQEFWMKYSFNSKVCRLLQQYEYY